MKTATESAKVGSKKLHHSQGQIASPRIRKRSVFSAPGRAGKDTPAGNSIHDAALLANALEIAAREAGNLLRSIGDPQRRSVNPLNLESDCAALGEELRTQAARLGKLLRALSAQAAAVARPASAGPERMPILDSMNFTSDQALALSIITEWEGMGIWQYFRYGMLPTLWSSFEDMRQLSADPQRKSEREWAARFYPRLQRLMEGKEADYAG